MNKYHGNPAEDGMMAAKADASRQRAALKNDRFVWAADEVRMVKGMNVPGMETYDEPRENTLNRVGVRNRAMRAAGNARDLIVMVDGPGEGQQTVMGLVDAIKEGFPYSWDV